MAILHKFYCSYTLRYINDFGSFCPQPSLSPRIGMPSFQGAPVTFAHRDFIWPFLRPYMGVIPNPKIAFIFPVSCIYALIFPILIKYFHKCEGKGSFLKSQIKSWAHNRDNSGSEYQDRKHPIQPKLKRNYEFSVRI